REARSPPLDARPAVVFLTSRWWHALSWCEGRGCVQGRVLPIEEVAVEWYDAASEYYKQTFPHDGRLSSLPAEWQRELVALLPVDQEINNGGYVQFLANHGRSTYDYASQALKAIGAHRMTEIIDGCQALVDEHFSSEGRPRHELSQLLPNPLIGRDGRTVKEAGSVLPEAVLA